ncbi:hypothetical protein [Flavobacterium mesophilum]|uniref:hypothetical protein n=1 Tax=Flavobacterium mesophilum TaxID=3143495 RepID=UPI0031D83937
MKINYKENIVAFLDVLGFSNLVYNKTNDLIESYFSYLLEELHNLNKDGIFSVLFISDSIVISTDASEVELKKMIRFIAKVQYFLLLKGILIRGAISYGNLYLDKDKNIIVGPGLINAYNLESKASTPRVIIDRRLITRFFKNTIDFTSYINSNEFGNTDNEEFIKSDSEDSNQYLYINYLRYTTRLSKTYLHGRTETITSLLKSNYYSDNNYFKYHWLLKNLKEELSKTILLYNSVELKNKTSISRLKKMRIWEEELMLI